MCKQYTLHRIWTQFLYNFLIRNPLKVEPRNHQRIIPHFDHSTHQPLMYLRFHIKQKEDKRIQEKRRQYIQNCIRNLIIRYLLRHMKKSINFNTFPLFFRAIPLSRNHRIDSRNQKHHHQSKHDNFNEFEVESLRLTYFIYLISLAAYRELLFLMLHTTITDKILSGLKDSLIVDFTKLCCFSVDGCEVQVGRDLEWVVLLWIEIGMLLVEVGRLGLG